MSENSKVKVEEQPRDKIPAPGRKKTSKSGRGSDSAPNSKMTKKNAKKTEQAIAKKMELDMAKKMEQDIAKKIEQDIAKKIETEKPSAKKSEKPIAKKTEKLIAKKTKQSIAKKIEQSMAKKNEQPTAKKPKHPKVKKTEQPIAEETEKPTEKPSGPPLEKSPETPGEKSSAPPVEESQPARTPKPKPVLHKALKLEDEKYPDIDFNVPAADWSKEDKSKMREVIRSISLMYKKQSNKERVCRISHQIRNSGSVERMLAREIIGLLQKDSNLMYHMQLKHVAFNTFTKNTYDWGKVAELLGNNHTPAECKEYWYMDLYPRIKNMGFSEANDKQLMELAIEHKFKNWNLIAERMIGHTEYQCYVHFRRNLYKNMKNIQIDEKKTA